MPQTMLALLALMIAMTLSFNTQREVIHSQREMIANELEVMATGISLQVMETIRTRAFDAAVVDEPYGTHAPSDFEKPPFNRDGDGENACWDTNGWTDVCDDIDDFHGMEVTVPFEMGDELSIPFAVKVEVQYVGGNLAGVNGKKRTYQKEVTVYVQDDLDSGARPFLTRPIRLSRIFAYGDQVRSTDNSEGWFEGFMDWFMAMLRKNPRLENGTPFKDWAVGLAQAKEWNGLPPKIQSENEREIEAWINGHPEAQAYMKGAWFNQIAD